MNISNYYYSLFLSTSRLITRGLLKVEPMHLIELIERLSKSPNTDIFNVHLKSNGELVLLVEDKETSGFDTISGGALIFHYNLICDLLGVPRINNLFEFIRWNLESYPCESDITFYLNREFFIESLKDRIDLIKDGIDDSHLNATKGQISINKIRKLVEDLEKFPTGSVTTNYVENTDHEGVIALFYIT